MSKLTTNVALDQFTYPGSTAQQTEFAEKSVSLLAEIINHKKFLSAISTAKFSHCVLLDEHGRAQEVGNEKVIEVIQTGKEWKSTADGIVNLSINVEELKRRVVGVVYPPSPMINTNKLFFDYWLTSGDSLSLAAHWLHEWLHVAGFHHKGGAVDVNDLNYVVGKIAVEVGRSILKSTADKKSPNIGQGYLDAINNYFETVNAPSFVESDLDKSAQSSLQLAFLDLGGDSWQEQGKQYTIIPASSGKLRSLPVPESAVKALKVDVLAFYNDHLPDFLGGTKEGLFKVSINTLDPNSTAVSKNEVTVAIDFKVKDGNYAPGFLHKGIFKNVLFTDFVNLKFDLFEVDKDVDVYYDKVKKVIDSVPEMRTLDILNGIPYLNLATKLFDGIIKAFGKNADDHIWNEMPSLDIAPLLGGAFLRDGIYVIFEERNSKKEKVTTEDLQLKDKELVINGKKITRLPNHLILSVGISASSKSLS
ncbi:hypothetical protein [Sphingobacterium sp. BIGb0116]|uniref:hypothetical protein n=1 Tax=Sphingobacterium sp. BIGb0116 TaxID=2940619 RepID=UPI002169826F|nr:hypothetical protein [Sphingobacterium sp. BIGb0116]MCS4168515.1 hypothetical protein [Sphingobacterium sp. BIGb0116]